MNSSTSNEQTLLDQFKTLLGPDMTELITYLLEKQLDPTILLVASQKLQNVLDMGGYGEVSMSLQDGRVTFIKNQTIHNLNRTATLPKNSEK